MLFRVTIDDIFASLVWSRKYAKYFTTIASMSWEDCTALQAADLIAYESFKWTDFHKQKRFDMRRSLQAIVGTKVPLKGGYFTQDGLLSFARSLKESQTQLYQDMAELLGSDVVNHLLSYPPRDPE